MLYIKNLSINLVFLTCLFSWASCQNPQPDEATKHTDEILIGAEYFNGWWEKSPNKWEYQGEDWRKLYPERIPLFGEYNSQETMDKDIEVASKYGVDFFSILWYYGGNVKENAQEESDLLNSGLTYFMNSRNAANMKFMVELCNHEPFAIVTDEDWQHCMDVCIQAMRHPSYLRIDGQAVLKIHAGEQFYLDNGSDIQRSKQVVQRLREQAKKEGIGELLIVVGSYGKGPINSNHVFAKIEEIDGTMQYMDLPDLPQKDTDYPYSALLNWAKEIRDVRKTDYLPWVPYFPVGWNPRPWHDPRASFRFPNRSEWKRGLEELRSDLLASPQFGFKKRDGTLQKAFTIYAWNEFGEGGILTPTNGSGYEKLEVLREVFKDR